MGQQILYCAACQSQLRGRAFDAGDAVRAGGQAYCAGCVPEGAKPDVPEPDDMPDRDG